jgi:hypothetical protein
MIGEAGQFVSARQMISISARTGAPAAQATVSAADEPDESCHIRLHESANAEVFGFLVRCAPTALNSGSDPVPLHDIR